MIGAVMLLCNHINRGVPSFALLAQEYKGAINGAHGLLTAWMAEANGTSKLLPENIANSTYCGQPYKASRTPRWSVQDTGADLHSGMGWITGYLNRSDMLDAGSDVRVALAFEATNCSRVDSMPDDWNIDTDAFYEGTIDMDRIINGSAEYLRDNLLLISEMIGTTNVWFDRLEDIATDLMTWVDTNRGGIPISHPAGGDPGYNTKLTQYHATNGMLLQVLSRLYAATATGDYRTWMEQIADDVLVDHDGDYIPTREPYLKLLDHGGEIVEGLVEALMCEAADGQDAKVDDYEPGIREMLDRLLAIGRWPSGQNQAIFYQEINPNAGTIIDSSPTDTWGYIYNAYRTYDLAMNLHDGSASIYSDVLQSAMDTIAGNTINPPGIFVYDADYYADALESMLYHATYLTIDGVDDWLQDVMGRMLARQLPNGFVDKQYADGNFGRSAIMYAAYIALGIMPVPFDESLEIVANLNGNTLTLVVGTSKSYSGVLVFDYERHSVDWSMPVYYPRTNHWPEWYTVDAGTNYNTVLNGASPVVKTGAELIAGYAIDLHPNRDITILVYPA